MYREYINYRWHADLEPSINWLLMHITGAQK